MFYGSILRVAHVACQIEALSRRVSLLPKSRANPGSPTIPILDCWGGGSRDDFLRAWVSLW